MTKTERDIELLKQSIQHYNKMIKCGRQLSKDNPYGTPLWDSMLYRIGEDWNASSCVLCQRYGDEDNNCPDCPYANVYGMCSGETKNHWWKMSNARSWLIWVDEAIIVRSQLKYCLAKLRSKG